MMPEPIQDLIDNHIYKYKKRLKKAFIESTYFNDESINLMFTLIDDTQ